MTYEADMAAAAAVRQRLHTPPAAEEAKQVHGWRRSADQARALAGRGLAGISRRNFTTGCICSKAAAPLNSATLTHAAPPTPACTSNATARDTNAISVIRRGLVSALPVAGVHGARKAIPCNLVGTCKDLHENAANSRRLLNPACSSYSPAHLGATVALRGTSLRA